MSTVGFLSSPIALSLLLMFLVARLIRLAWVSWRPRASSANARPPIRAMISYAVATAFLAAAISRQGGPGWPTVLGWVASVVLSGIVALGILLIHRNWLYNRAWGLVGRGRIDEAEGLVQASLECRPPVEPAEGRESTGARADRRGAERLMLMGDLKIRRGDWAAALVYFRHAERILGKADPVICCRIGWTMMNLDQVIEGLKILYLAISSLPKSAVVDRVFYTVIVVQVWTRMGLLVEARRLLDEAQASMPYARLLSRSTRRLMFSRLASARASLEGVEAGRPPTDWF